MDVKICGVCRPEDARVAAEAGAAYVGVILAPGFARTRTVADAEAIYDAAGPRTRRVGVFVNGSEAEILRAAAQLRLDVIQLHGSEGAYFAARLRDAGDAQVWKALRPRTAAHFVLATDEYADAVDALLLDGAGSGGTGSSFPWAEVSAARAALPATLRLVVAGGLNPGNVATAARILQPDVVDVSSGVETRSCEKDHSLVRAFVDAARRNGEVMAHG